MAYKPDKYHQTDPPCELKSAVMGRQNSRKKNEAKEETKPENGSLSGAAPCSVVVSDTPETDRLAGKIDVDTLEHDAYATMVNHALRLERERDTARDLAHDLAVELYSSQHIPEKSNASRLIKMAMLLPNVENSRRQNQPNQKL